MISKRNKLLTVGALALVLTCGGSGLPCKFHFHTSWCPQGGMTALSRILLMH